MARLICTSCFLIEYIVLCQQFWAILVSTSWLCCSCNLVLLFLQSESTQVQFAWHIPNFHQKFPKLVLTAAIATVTPKCILHRMFSNVPLAYSGRKKINDSTSALQRNLVPVANSSLCKSWCCSNLASKPFHQSLCYNQWAVILHHHLPKHLFHGHLCSP